MQGQAATGDVVATRFHASRPFKVNLAEVYTGESGSIEYLAVGTPGPNENWVYQAQKQNGVRPAAVHLRHGMRWRRTFGSQCNRGNVQGCIYEIWVTATDDQPPKPLFMAHEITAVGATGKDLRGQKLGADGKYCGRSTLAFLALSMQFSKSSAGQAARRLAAFTESTTAKSNPVLDLLATEATRPSKRKAATPAVVTRRKPANVYQKSGFNNLQRDVYCEFEKMLARFPEGSADALFSSKGFKDKYAPTLFGVARRVDCKLSDADLQARLDSTDVKQLLDCRRVEKYMMDMQKVFDNTQVPKAQKRMQLGHFVRNYNYELAMKMFDVTAYECGQASLAVGWHGVGVIPEKKVLSRQRLPRAIAENMSAYCVSSLAVMKIPFVLKEQHAFLKRLRNRHRQYLEFYAFMESLNVPHDCIPSLTSFYKEWRRKQGGSNFTDQKIKSCGCDVCITLGIETFAAMERIADQLRPMCAGAKVDCDWQFKPRVDLVRGFFLRQFDFLCLAESTCKLFCLRYSLGGNCTCTHHDTVHSTAFDAFWILDDLELLALATQTAFEKEDDESLWKESLIDLKGILFEVGELRSNFQAFIGHRHLTVQQRKPWVLKLVGLAENHALAKIDYGMKLDPTTYWIKQSAIYGQSGCSAHLCCVTTPVIGTPDMFETVTIISLCADSSQTWFHALSSVELGLKLAKETLPHITDIDVLELDAASYYRSGGFCMTVASAEFEDCVGLRIHMQNFTATGDGKDDCDTNFAWWKKSVAGYVMEQHHARTPEEYAIAANTRPVIGQTTVVTTLDHASAMPTPSPPPNITCLFTICGETDADGKKTGGIRYWDAFEIGSMTVLSAEQVLKLWKGAKQGSTNVTFHKPVAADDLHQRPTVKVKPSVDKKVLRAQKATAKKAAKAAKQLEKKAEEQVREDARAAARTTLTCPTCGRLFKTTVWLNRHTPKCKPRQQPHDKDVFQEMALVRGNTFQFNQVAMTEAIQEKGRKKLAAQLAAAKTKRVRLGAGLDGGRKKRLPWDQQDCEQYAPAVADGAVEKTPVLRQPGAMALATADLQPGAAHAPPHCLPSAKFKCSKSGVGCRRSWCGGPGGRRWRHLAGDGGGCAAECGSAPPHCLPALNLNVVNQAWAAGDPDAAGPAAVGGGAPLATAADAQLGVAWHHLTASLPPQR
jgi:hypothetical protein